MAELLSSVKKAIEILNTFDLYNQELTAQEISQHTKTPLSSLYKYLNVLLDAQMLERDIKTKKYVLGLAMFKLGITFEKRNSFVDIAFPYMEALSKETNETVLLNAIHGYESICVKIIESTRLVKIAIQPGDTRPLHAGAAQKVLLAFQDDSFVDKVIKNTELIKFTNRTITDPIKLKKELIKVRNHGFAVAYGEVDIGYKAVAAPIFNHLGGLTASLTVAGPNNRIDEATLRELIPIVRTSAERISIDLGFRATRI